MRQANIPLPTDSIDSKMKQRTGSMQIPIPISVEQRRPVSHIRPRLVAMLGIILLVAWYGLPSLSHHPCNHGSRIEPKVGEVIWSVCTGEEHLPGAECGSIVVPLDYFDSSVGVATIALGRYNATSEPRRGIVLVNPGGPGGPGKQLATAYGAQLQEIIGSEYDIIGFDPRGIGETVPTTHCFPSPEDYRAFKAHTVLDRGADVGPDLDDPGNRERLIRLQREADVLLKTQFKICNDSMGPQLRYMGTSTVVRDIDFITAVLEGEDALINFWGVSYGSVIGQYLVNMLPHRVGRVVIDGVVDAPTWAEKPYYKWYEQFLSSTMDAYNIFASDCSDAGPELCPLAHEKGEDPALIVARVEGYVAQLYDEPLAVPDATQPGILTSGLLRSYILQRLQSPLSWPEFAQDLAHAIQDNGTAILSTLQVSWVSDLERSAVSCNDNKPFAPPNADEVVDALLKAEMVAPFAFAIIGSEADAGCQFWPVQPPERFQGPWNHTLRNPILIVSNTADPVTPIVNGRIVYQLLQNSSGLLIQNSPGHTSLSLPSLCTSKNVRQYFQDGTLPPEGTICQPDVVPFETQDGANVLSEHDTVALESLKQLGHVLAKRAF